MASNIGASINKVKRKTVRTTIELRKELISQREGGKRVSDIAREYGIPKSTISTILKNADAIKKVDVAKGVTSLTTQRSHNIETTEKLLLVWIREKQMAGENITEKIICEKAKQLHDDLKKNNPGTSTRGQEFKASKGWFDRFKRRSGIYNDNEMAKRVVGEFQEFIDSEGYVPEQVFHCDETVLFWKKMPKLAGVIQDEVVLPGEKPTKDRLTLLLCGNISGDFKLKPLLVYLADNPRVFLKHGVQKNKLGVMWRANNRAWVTPEFLTEWVNEVFAPKVKKYLVLNNLPLKALLLMDSTPSHPSSLGDDLVRDHCFITVKFVPPSIIPLIQPISQQMIPNFKQLYTKALFERCFDLTSDTDLTFEDFWKSYFNLLQCVRLIVKAWEDVPLKTINCGWLKLWPDTVGHRDFKEESVVQELISLGESMGLKADQEDVAKLWSDYVTSRNFEAESESVVRDIISLGESMGLEVDQEDVQDLIDHHWRDNTTEELQDLNDEQTEEYFSMKDEDGVHEAQIPTAELNELLSYWSKTQSIVEKWHPDIALVNHNINSFNVNVVEHFRKIKRGRRTATFDRCISKRKTLGAPAVSESLECLGSNSPESSSLSVKRQEEDHITPEVLDVYIEDNSLLNNSLPYLQFQLCQSSQVSKDYEERREAEKFKRVRLKLEAKKAQRAAVAKHKLLPESELKEGANEDVEVEEVVVPILKGKSFILDSAMAADYEERREAEKFKRARLNLEAKKAQRAAVAKHKLLPEPKLKVGANKDLEVEEVVVSTLKEKTSILDSTMAADYEERREAEKFKRARLNLEAKKAQRAAVAEHKLLPEPKLKERVNEVVELEEVVVPTLKEKPPILDKALAADYEERETVKFKRARLNPEAKKAQHPAVAKHKLLPEPKLREGPSKDAEVEEIVVPTLKEKPSSLECTMVAEIKEEHNVQNILELKEEIIDIKTEPLDDVHLGKKLPVGAPGAIKSCAKKFEEVWIKSEDVPENTCS